MNKKEFSHKLLRNIITIVVMIALVILYAVSKDGLTELISPVSSIANAFNNEKNKVIDECTSFINAGTKGRRIVQLNYSINDKCIEQYGLDKIKGSANVVRDYFIFQTKGSDNYDLYIKKQAIFELLYFDNNSNLLFQSVINPDDYKK